MAADSGAKRASDCFDCDVVGVGGEGFDVFLSPVRMVPSGSARATTIA